MSSRSLVIAASALFLVACDNRQAFHEPEITLSRMLEQKRADPWQRSRVFSDGMTMRTPPRGTVPHDDEEQAPPPAITRDLVVLGRARFETVCATCHGIRGDGHSVVATKMEHRPPPSLHEARIRGLSRAQVFEVATHGYGLMPGFVDVLETRERWAVAAYVQALQISQGAHVAELPEGVRADLGKEAP